MNGEFPLIAVGGSGAAMLAGIHLRERRAEDAMRASRVRLAVTFPASVDPAQATAALGAIRAIQRCRYRRDRLECACRAVPLCGLARRRRSLGHQSAAPLKHQINLSSNKY